MVMSASAQLNRHGVRGVQPQPVNTLQSRPQAKVEVMQMREPGTPVVKAQRKATPPTRMYYRRPAGAFYCNTIVEDGINCGMAITSILAVKPYTFYTFKSIVEGAGPDATCEWDVQTGEETDSGYESKWDTVSGEDLAFKWGLGVFEAPILYVMDGDDFYSWALHGYEMGGTPDAPTVINVRKGYIYSLPSTMYFWGEDYLKSSKGFYPGGRNGDYFYPMTYYSGAVPSGDNEKGYWFGKNGGTTHGQCIDGIAQAFEKPTAPYLLNQVVLECAFLEVKAQTQMTCKIYKLDAIPPYSDTDVAVLPEQPGELIARGRAIIDPETNDKTGGLVFFTLYGEEDGLEYEITPTIDFPILVAIDGYNDPEMNDLVDFSAMISSDIHTDEGFGELAYLKYGVKDVEGHVDHYEWVGLNNFFEGDEMKTGLTIFLSTELPYLTFNREEEDGVYRFPNEGGLMEKHFGDYTVCGIEFLSWEPSADDYWWVHCNSDDVPDWLTIKLEDQMEFDEFTGIVNATVTAEPLPEGVHYREAVVRFEYPGAYQDYKFIQGEIGPIDPPEPPFYYLNIVIGIILGDKVSDDVYRKADINNDGVVNVTDLNKLIELIIRYS